MSEVIPLRNKVLVGMLVFGLIAPAAVIAQGALSPAGAVAAVTCTKIKGNDATFTFTIGGCALPGRVTASGSDGQVTWSKGGGTTIWDDTGGDVQTGPNLCGKHDLIWIVSGTVTGGTSPYTHVGDPVSFTLCGAPLGRTSGMRMLKGPNVVI